MGTEVLTSSHSRFWEWALGEQEAAEMDPDQSSPSQGWGDADTRVCLSLFCVAPGSRLVCVSGPPGVCVRDTDSMGRVQGSRRVVPHLGRGCGEQVGLGIS